MKKTYSFISLMGKVQQLRTKENIFKNFSVSLVYTPFFALHPVIFSIFIWFFPVNILSQLFLVTKKDMRERVENARYFQM